MALFDNMDDPQKLALLTMGLGLMSPKPYKTNFLGDVAEAGLLGLNAYSGARAQQRASKKEELATLATLYKPLLDQENQARVSSLFTGQPYTPSPMLTRYQERIGSLLGPSGQDKPIVGGLLGSPSGEGQPPQSPLAGFNPGARQLPEGPESAPRLPYTAQAPQPQPLPFNGPAPQAQRPPMGAPQAPRTPTLPEMLSNIGIPPALAAQVAQTPEGQRSLINKLAEAYGPRVVNNVLMQYQANGQTRFLGGVVGQDAVPVTTDANGNPQLRPIPGSSEYFANRAGAVADAQERAKARNDLVPIPQADGSTRYVSRAQALAMTGQQQPSQIPPEVIAADRTGVPFHATQAPGGPVTFDRGGPGFPAGQSTAAKTAAEVQPRLQLEQLTKSFEEANKVNGSLMFIDTARKAVNGATTTGLFAKPALLAARVGSAFGVTDPAAAADPEVFMAASATNVMNVIKSLGSGSGISDADREYAAKAVGGDIKLNRDSINRLLDIQERAIRRAVELHNKRVEQAGKSGVPSVYDYRVEPYQGGGSNSVTAPNGKVYTFPDAQAAQRFKQQIGAQ